MKLSVNNIKNLTIDDLLGGKLECECGKNHECNVKSMIIENSAIKKIPDLLKKLEFKNILMIADTNTYKVAGKNVETILDQEKINYKRFIYRTKKDELLVPDENAIGSLFTKVEKGMDLILAVGSGVLNDLSKFVSYRLGIDCIIVATAPSMDGFISDGSSLIVDDLKSTFVSQPPKAVVGDIDILKEAPMDMILAGFGDIIGKYSALCDWKLSKIVNDEYYCDVVVKMVKDSLNKCVGSTDGIKKREDSAIKNLMESLLLTGIAMSYIGNSRPASGAEHHMSHYWELMFLFQGKKALFHGTKVGISTVLITKLRELLEEEKLNFDKAVDNIGSFDEKEWESEVTKLYEKAAPEIIAVSKKEGTNSTATRLKRVGVIRKKLDEVIESMKDTPSSEEIKSILRRAGAPALPNEVGISDKIVFNSVLMAKEVRIRYTVLQLLGDFGLLEKFAHEIMNYLKEEK
ncbi:MAG: sn-glycerol-1-phosphate dehydrogenase [Clostridium sp.]|jgi:glycerol-1-phosphate dehydrogenase [NAD(P)+]|uniref:sn-glycerol-1-phosphate dehydrogenase n=1 Tax=Clostridium sp. TaxID=1506 RepID=UPI0025B9B31F|nr:sn-glycerol-1-phosphate dehydrogenase [Clostridium sp.]MCH3965780.1 sn-glycerol-1-phosphate dehydrogenase [Clostridium sp.]MCI1717189.1 sn-glycerol-1-phosphate dehydrogenase [Clostridium sp.]MCI1801529.1 sn-glycerol-1-phosphate dehydrogenase [Clostridium sp.]MCI1815340.1 sn-glycerol-1-phosphate dehydrogenase [Clostridium sp.]MCI1872243.1 sn-glycerol-1-phosphate dehydrogenase [Clostridium sp.]